MNLFEAFDALDKISRDILIESANISTYKQILAEIAQIEAEIKSLQQQKSKKWSSDYVSRLKDSEKALIALRQELMELEQSYKEYWYTEREQDDDRYYFYDKYRDNPEKKAAVADKEAELRDRLKKLEAEHDALTAKVKADFETDLADHTKTIADRIAMRDAKKGEIEAARKTVIDEVKAELSQKCADVAHLVTPAWDKLVIKDTKIILPLVSEPYSVEITDEDFDEDDNFLYDNVLEAATESYLESDEYYEIIELIVEQPEDDPISAIDTDKLLSIPNSEWQLNCDIDTEIIGKVPEVYSHWHDPGDYWNPPEGEFEFDTEMNIQATFYLVKQL